VAGNELSLLTPALGVAAVAGGAVWRQTTHRRTRSRLARELSSEDPAVRIAAGTRAVTYGLTTASRCLLPAVANDSESDVRRAIALAVAHRQWEPGGSARVLALRTWASEELKTQGYDVKPFGPAFTRISDMGGPQRPAPPAAVSA
jgi:hypothetical protein